MDINNTYELMLTKDYYNDIDNELTDLSGLRRSYLDSSITVYEKTLDKKDEGIYNGTFEVREGRENLSINYIDKSLNFTLFFAEKEKITYIQKLVRKLNSFLSTKKNILIYSFLEPKKDTAFKYENYTVIKLNNTVYVYLQNKIVDSFNLRHLDFDLYKK